MPARQGSLGYTIIQGNLNAEMRNALSVLANEDVNEISPRFDEIKRLIDNVLAQSAPSPPGTN